jgi:hypothetical protein
MADDELPPPGTTVPTRVRVGIALLVLGAGIVGLTIWHDLDRPVPAIKGNTVGNVTGGKGTWQHFFEHSSTNPTTTTWPLLSSTTTTVAG